MLPAGARSIGTTPQVWPRTTCRRTLSTRRLAWTGRLRTTGLASDPPLLRDLAIFAAMATGVNAAGAALTAGAAGGGAAGGRLPAPEEASPSVARRPADRARPHRHGVGGRRRWPEAGTAALAGGIPTGGGMATDALVGEAGQEAAASAAQQAAQGGIDSASRDPEQRQRLRARHDRRADWAVRHAGALDRQRRGGIGGRRSSGGLIGRVISGLGSGAADVVGNLVRSVGPAIAMKVLAGEVQPPTQDPALAAAIQGQLDLARTAESRAQANDDYWKANFAPAAAGEHGHRHRAVQAAAGLQPRVGEEIRRPLLEHHRALPGPVLQGRRPVQHRSRTASASPARPSATRRGFSTARAIAGRDLARMGINPASGRYTGALRQLALDEALASRGGHAGTARRRGQGACSSEATAAGMNANLPGATNAAGNAAGNAANIASQVSAPRRTPGARTTPVQLHAWPRAGRWRARRLGLSLTNSAWQAQTANTNQRNQIIGAGLGMLWGAES